MSDHYRPSTTPSALQRSSNLDRRLVADADHMGKAAGVNFLRGVGSLARSLAEKVVARDRLDRHEFVQMVAFEHRLQARRINLLAATGKLQDFVLHDML